VPKITETAAFLQLSAKRQKEILLCGGNFAVSRCSDSLRTSRPAALALPPSQITHLVEATGERTGRPAWTYSDIRSRLYPAALAKAYPNDPLRFDHLRSRRREHACISCDGGPLMERSPLFGRRIHVSGSIVEDPAIASPEDVKRAREFVAALVKELIKRGATFVVPVDAEPLRKIDGLPICFDWLTWETLKENLPLRPGGAPVPLAVAVQHHKTEEQIPVKFQALWDELRGTDLVKIENAAYWNMASKRMDVQARWGDIFIPVGGTEGVLFLANLYHDAGKPVVPVNAAICPQNTGSRRLFDFALANNNTRRLFQTMGSLDPHGWINRINFPSRKPVSERVNDFIELLEAIDPPKAFVVRLLNPDHEDYAAVQDFFDTVVQPVVEGDLGYKLTVVDGKQIYEHPRIDQEIFAKLHRSNVVIADITGLRPNCFLELGYALGRGLPTMLTAKDGTSHPFDIYTLSGFHWKTTGSAAERRRLFREHWDAIRTRPPLVPVEPLIP
jgi:hypothetical protein